MNTNKNEHQQIHDNHALQLTINDKKYDWNLQYITGSEIRALGSISEKDELFLAIKRPWEDEPIMNDTKIDLARQGIEHFYSVMHGNHHFVIIHVNDIERKVTRGKHTVSEIKQISEVPLTHELEELIDGKLTPLKDDASVLIKGGEQFFSHLRDGSSS
jgi:hypothetical protein